MMAQTALSLDQRELNIIRALPEYAAAMERNERELKEGRKAAFAELADLTRRLDAAAKKRDGKLQAADEAIEELRKKLADAAAARDRIRVDCLSEVAGMERRKDKLKVWLRENPTNEVAELRARHEGAWERLCDSGRSDLAERWHTLRKELSNVHLEENPGAIVQRASRELDAIESSFSRAS